MAQNVYECLFLFDANRYARDPGGVSGGIPTMIEGVGGEILASRLWNEQKLAYPIRGQRKGTYWLTYFRVDSSKLGEFNRACQLNDNVLRNLVVKVEPRLVDVLVAHAQGKAPEDAPAESKAASGGEAAKTEPAKAEATKTEAAKTEAGEGQPAETS